MSPEHQAHAPRPRVLAALLSVLALASAAQAEPARPLGEAERGRVVEVALNYRGVPYVYGAESSAAFDCSGFVRYVYREALGVTLPRSARDYPSVGTPIDWRAAKPGDIFIYDTVGGRPSHVSIFIGEGQVIHAVSAGPRTGVILSPLSDRYWSARLIAARSLSNLPAPTPLAPKAPSPGATAVAPTSQTPSKPSSEKGLEVIKPSEPSRPQTAASDEPPIADIGLAIPAIKTEELDRIPTAAGTGVAFTLTNDTGKDGSFIVLFFRVNPKTYKLEPLHEEKLRLAAKASHGLPSYRFTEPGKYKLVVKDSWGNQLLSREFMVQ